MITGTNTIEAKKPKNKEDTKKSYSDEDEESEKSMTSGNENIAAKNKTTKRIQRNPIKMKMKNQKSQRPQVKDT